MPMQISQSNYQTSATTRKMSYEIEFAKIENKPVMLTGDFRTNHYDCNEKQTFHLPYGPKVLNTEHPKNSQEKSKSLIVFITVNPNADFFFETSSSDSLF